MIIIYGIASSLTHDIEDFYLSAEEAETALAQVFADEPELEAALWVKQVEFQLSAN